MPKHTAPALAAIARLIRPHQWLKNGFVLMGAIFGQRWHDPDAWVAVLGVFVAFCAVASAVYVYNDLSDVEADRRHPTKCRRPIASGQVSVPQAWALVLGLLALALGLSWQVAPAATGFVAAYAVLNVAYTHRLKHMVIIDVFCIAAGFMLRILSGTLGLGIAPSSWLLLCGLMVTLFLGFAKRRAELLQLGQLGQDQATARKVLGDYQPVVLESFLAITASCTVLSYSLYTVSADTVQQHGTDKLVYTVPLIVYAIFRYFHLLHGHGSGQDTARDLLTDRHLLLTVAGWLALTVGILA